MHQANVAAVPLCHRIPAAEKLTGVPYSTFHVDQCSRARAIRCVSLPCLVSWQLDVARGQIDRRGARSTSRCRARVCASRLSGQRDFRAEFQESEMHSVCDTL